MVTSESEFESDLSDDEIEDGTGANTMNDIYDDDGDDNGDFDMFDDTDRFRSLWDSIMQQTAPNRVEISSVDIPPHYSVRLAMDSQPHPSNNSNSSVPFVDDSLYMYLTAPPLIRKVVNTDKHCLSIDPTINESTSSSLSTSELYVGNVSPSATWRELRNWFSGLGYGVSRVDLKINKKGARYAFVRFDSISIATDVLYKSETKATNFVFKGKTLDIKLGKGPLPKRIITPLTTTTLNNTPISANFQISDIHYGTLITGAAMKNIQSTNSIISNDEFGIIAHNLMNSNEYKTSFTFNINTEKKKLAIIGKFDSSMTFISILTEALKFEWNFRDLKAKKITPVLINQNEIYLLMELRRSPIILETQDISSMWGDATKETRLPGNPLIGHANVWLFKLSSYDPDQDYRKLFEILHRYNLSHKKFSGFNIIHLIRPIQAARKNIEPVQLISNDKWLKKQSI